MGYIIAYDSMGGKYEVSVHNPWRFPVLCIAALCMFLFLTFHFWPEGSTLLRSVLIPGEDAVTVQAFQNMTQDLKAGASVPDAIEAFCKEVIHSDNGSD